ncbi:MAG: hypothetical protein WDN26_09650 [Chitinophagaceae bacterium]
MIEILKESPVVDLRKAIGINDRFLFINDLFRGDESCMNAVSKQSTASTYLRKRNTD